jgi:potassium uptake Trk family protein
MDLILKARRRMTALIPASVRAFFKNNKRYLRPSFISVHYLYIGILIILGSIMFYPVKTTAYIDALFFATSACTQGGLNTVDIPLISLYQQILLYVLPMFTNPIFIHSSLVFLRLYWFEKKINNVNLKSKMQSKMRRNFTMNQHRQNSDIELGMLSPVVSQPEEKQQQQQQQQDGARRNSFLSFNTILSAKSKLFSLEKMVDPPNRRIARKMSFNTAQSTNLRHSRTFLASDTDAVDTQPPPMQSRDIKFADVLPHPGHPNDSSTSSNENSSKSNSDSTSNTLKPLNERDIKFADPPAPPKMRRKNSVQPHEMAMSITMMEQQNLTKRKNSYSDGPALVIKGPLDDSSTDDDEYDDYDSKEDRDKSSDAASNSNIGLAPQLFFNNEKKLANFDGKLNDLDKLYRAKTNVAPPKKSKPSLGGRSYTSDRVHDIGKYFKRTSSFNKILNEKRAMKDQSRLMTNESEGSPLQHVMSSNYVSFEPTIGGNSVFVDLTDEQREELGGVEYRALKLLSKILIAYFVGFHLINAMMMMGWALGTDSYKPVYAEAGTNAVWWGFFTASSMFNDVGFTLTADSMSSFVNARYPLLVGSFFIVIGNTGFPCMLRLIIWIAFKLTPKFGRTHESLGFLLDHPRRCFTLLFPSHATWWLFAILVIFNTVDLILFICLDLNSPVVEDLSTSTKILAGLFQAFCTRTAGFSVINLAQVHVAVQVSYMVMMYVSVLPLAMSIRRTNVYEEQSLGVYYDPDHIDPEAPSLIATHIRKQLSFDLWFIFLGLFIITIAEGGRLGPGDESFSTFAVLFEIVSAYGTVGMSLGYPGTNASFSAQFTKLSKLVIIALLYRGRHRGLPYSLDRAIILPSDKLDLRDNAQEHRIRRAHEAIIEPDQPATATGVSVGPSPHSHLHLRQ